MGTFSFFFTFFSAISLLTKSSLANNCPVLKCGAHSPEIRFPFQIQNLQQQCGLPGFNLFCKNNNTVIHFPDYGDLIIKSICYDTKRLQLVDPKSCVHGVFLNLNLSSSPLSYYYVLKQYIYINCSSKLASFPHVPCLTGSNYHVYVLEPSFRVPDSCSSMRTVAIPFPYTRYLSGNSFGLDLAWDSTVLGHKTTKSENYLKVLSIAAFVLAVVLVSYTIVVRYNKEAETEELKSISDQEDVDMVMGEYEALVPVTDTKQLIL